jgi:hypothetical protein
MSYSSIREAALMANTDDSQCRQTNVDRWPEAARRTIEFLNEELDETESLLQIARNDARLLKRHGDLDAERERAWTRRAAKHNPNEIPCE